MKYRPKRLRRLDHVWLDHGQPTYFITIRTVGTANTLANAAVHKRLREFLLATASHHDWWASRYVLMPDHLHLFAIPGLSAVTLGAWVKALKACVAHREFKWQTGFFDHVLRGGESQSQKWEYIRQNPVRAGLIADADAWPFGGEIDWAQGDVATRGVVGPVSRPGGDATILASDDSTVTPPLRQETRPTAPSRIVGAAPAPDVGPVSRPGGDATIHASDDSAVTPPPRRETRPTSGATPIASTKAIVLVRHGAGDTSESRSDHVAVEEPLELRVEGHSVAVIMRTPGNDRELAAGFLLTENLIRGPADIFDVTRCGSSAADQVVNVTLRNPAAFDPAKLTRNVFSSSSCGVCSKATIDVVRQSFPPVQTTTAVCARTLLALPGRLRAKQETFNRTGGLHACALFNLKGELQELREDVGRHNALDKLAGWALFGNQLPLHDRILFLSGRVSFEMMQKALAAGIPIVAAISAPTSLAVEFAHESHQTLVGFVRGETMNIYAGAERIFTSAR